MKDALTALAGLAAVVAVILIGHLIVSRLQFGFYAADVWPKLEDEFSRIEGEANEAAESLERGDTVAARAALEKIQKQCSKVYGRYFAEEHD